MKALHYQPELAKLAEMMQQQVFINVIISVIHFVVLFELRFIYDINRFAILDSSVTFS